MIPYLALFFFLVGWAFLSNSLGRKSQSGGYREEQLAPWAALFFTFIATVPVVAIFAVRDGIGTDFPSYQMIYQRFVDGAGHGTEPGYTALNQLPAKFGLGFEFVLATSALLAFGPVFYRVFRNSPLPWLSMIVLFGLGYFFQATNHIRFCIASGLIFFGVSFIVKRNWKAWFSIVIIASMFHGISWGYSLLYFLAHRRVPPVLMAGVFTLALFAMLVPEASYRSLILFEFFSPPQYRHYISGYMRAALDRSSLGLGGVIYVGIFLFTAFVLYQPRDLNVFMRACGNLVMWGCCILIGMYHFGTLGRLATPLMLPLTIFLPMAFFRFQQQTERLTFVLFAIYIFVILFMVGLLVGAHNAVPYAHGLW